MFSDVNRPPPPAWWRRASAEPLLFLKDQRAGNRAGRLQIHCRLRTRVQWTAAYRLDSFCFFFFKLHDILFERKKWFDFQYIWLRVSQVVGVVKNPPTNAGYVRDVSSIPGSGKSPGGGHGNPLQYSCLGNPMDRGAWWTRIHGVSKESDRTEATWYACIFNFM